MSSTTAVKKRNYKKGRGKAKRVTKRRNKKSMGMTMRNTNNIVPLPPRYFTKLTVSNYGTTGIGAGSGDIRFAIQMNAPNLPFTFTPSAAFTWNGQAVATQNPAGWTQIFNNNLYTQYRVLGSKITVDVVQESIVDPVICTITPSLNNATPASVGYAMNEPFTKRMDFSVNRGNNKGLSNYITPYQFVGVPKKAIEYDLARQYTGSTVQGPAQLIYWIVIVETLDNTTFAAACNIRFSVTYYVELFGMSHGNVPQ